MIEHIKRITANVVILIASAFIGVLPYWALGITHYFPGVFGIIVATITGFVMLSLFFKTSELIVDYAKSKLDETNE